MSFLGVAKGKAASVGLKRESLSFPQSRSATTRSARTRSALSCALTDIYATAYIRSMESTFSIIAEPSRRAILSLLATAEQSVGDIELQLQLPQPSVSKHLRVLREAGFVESRVDAQRDRKSVV